MKRVLGRISAEAYYDLPAGTVFYGKGQHRLSRNSNFYIPFNEKGRPMYDKPVPSSIAEKWKGLYKKDILKR